MATEEVGPLKLKEFSCQMKVDDHSTTTDLTCLLNFTVANRKQSNDESQSIVDEAQDKITFEMSPSILDTLLEGLHRIQNQLSVAANKSS